MTDDTTKRARIAYEAFRGGLIPGLDPEVPRWEDAPNWIRDVAVVSYLQGILDQPKSGAAQTMGLRSALQAVYDFMHQDVASGDADLWTDDYTDLYTTVEAALTPGNAGAVEAVTSEDIARQLFAVDGNGFWEDRTPLQEEAYTIRAKAVAALYSVPLPATQGGGE
jgi:hypothetical protein